MGRRVGGNEPSPGAHERGPSLGSDGASSRAQPGSQLGVLLAPKWWEGYAAGEVSLYLATKPVSHH